MAKAHKCSRYCRFYPLRDAQQPTTVGDYCECNRPSLIGKPLTKLFIALLTASLCSSSAADTVSDYWVQFAKTGNPNRAGLPQWPRFTEGQLQHMVLDSTPQPAANLTPAAWGFFDKVMAARRD